MDAGAYDAAAFSRRSQSGGNERADRSEKDRRVERRRRGLVRAAGPHGAEPAREALRRLVAGAGERIDLAAFAAANLSEDVRGGAEAVEADASA